MTKYRSGAKNEQIAQLIDRTPFFTAAGLEGDQKIDMDRLSRGSALYEEFVGRLGDWALEQEVEVITAVPNGANRFARDVSRRLNLPLALYQKRRGLFVPYQQVRSGLDLINARARAGVIEDVRSTGYSVKELSRRIPRIAGACAIIDRGEDVAGIHTVPAARAYSRAFPYAPPAHIDTPFDYDALIHLPLGLRSADTEVPL